MDTGLKNKKALITGGGTGIGKAIALALAKEGVHISIASRNPHRETINEIKSTGVEVIWIKSDVSKETDVIKMINESIKGLGTLDLYINNAAAHWDEPVTKLTSDSWFNSINTNLSACVWSCRDVARHFISKKSGSILIVGSTTMYTTVPGETSYRVSKTGLKPYMELLAMELAPFGIRANMLTPGAFQTKILDDYNEISDNMDLLLNKIPLRRLGNPEKDIGQAAVFLLSDELSPYTTGAELIIDGGASIYPFFLNSDMQLKKMNS